MSAKKPFCLMPWIHFHVSDRGKVKACCVANIPYGDVNNDSFTEIWEGDAIRKIRNQFYKGEPDNRCVVCIKREQAGAKSIRLETFEKYSDEVNFTHPTPFYFDIRFSNICNFACRTCWHGASSKWFQDAQALNRAIAPKAIIQNIHDFNAFIARYGEYLKNAKEIYLAGGEPLVTEEHYLLLNWLIKEKANPLLRYNTNLSVLKYKGWNAVELWKHFEHVEVMASVDGYGELGEYIRHGFNWQRFSENLSVIQNEDHITLKIAPTISVLNMAHFPLFYNELQHHFTIQPKQWYLNLLERPYYYNIKSFLAEEKQKIHEIYLAFIAEQSHQNDFHSLMLQLEDCLKFMQEGDLTNHRKALNKETLQVDQLRKENFNNYPTLQFIEKPD